jgi:hypothetical protein
MKRKNKPQLAIEHAETLAAKIENEGELDYVLENWEFKEFRDKKFTSLRKAFIKAKTDLMDYAALWRIEDGEFEEPEPRVLNASTDYAAHCAPKCRDCGDTLEEDGSCGTCEDERNR